MNKLLLVGLLVGIAAGGVVLASAFQGVLATISYHITGPQQSIITMPANINLGNLTAGESGKITTNATLKLLSSGNYTFKLNEEALRGEFSNFTVVLKFANYTITLTREDPESNPVYIQAGNYTVGITIYFTVSDHPHTETVNNAPLIIVKLAGEGGDEDNNS